MSVRFAIDSLDFVRNESVRRGKIHAAEFVRLQSYLYDGDGELTYTVNGLFNKNGKPILRLVIAGGINLCCQRCLGKLKHTLDLQADLLLARSENELQLYDENDEIDCILASEDMNIMMLIEDEIILNLSISSCHQKDECSLKSLNSSNQANDKALIDHPFAALATLKKTH